MYDFCFSCLFVIVAIGASVSKNEITLDDLGKFHSAAEAKTLVKDAEYIAIAMKRSVGRIIGCNCTFFEFFIFSNIQVLHLPMLRSLLVTKEALNAISIQFYQEKGKEGNGILPREYLKAIIGLSLIHI